MGRIKKTLQKIIRGASDGNIRFDELKSLLTALGFSLRIRGDHYIFYKDEVEEILNLQPVNGKAKPYQVKQIRNLIVKYKIELK